MKAIIYVVGIVIIIGVIVLFGVRCKKSQQGSIKPKDNPYTDLRNNIFSSSPESLGFKVNDDEPYGTIMEIGFPEATATLVTFIDGTTSLYLSSGGGVIGGGFHESVKKASVAFIAKSKDYVNRMAKVDNYPVPQRDYVRFYILTRTGVYSLEVREADFSSGTSDFTDLYLCGQNVITQLRKTADK